VHIKNNSAKISYKIYNRLPIKVTILSLSLTNLYFFAIIT